MSRCLVLGATGYVGALLTTTLMDAGHEVTAAARHLPHGPPPRRVSRCLSVDATDSAQVRQAIDDVDVVYFLVHSLKSDDVTAKEGRAATVLAEAAADAGVTQIVYLGGTRPDSGSAPVSRHLASRADVGDILLAAPVPALVLQASMIIGAGSASFTLLRAAAKASPLLLNPSWMSCRSRPVAETDVVHYLTAAASLSAPINEIAEVCGPEALTYLRLVQRTARIMGLPARFPVPVPLWSHRLAAGMAGLCTPVPGAVARSLFESLSYELLPHERPAAEVLPEHAMEATPVDVAIRQACGIETRAAPSGPRFLDEHVITSDVPPERIWRRILNVGGDDGRPTLPLLWALRGVVDHLAGGVGLYRGRGPDLGVGDVVDSWTVHRRDDAAHCLVLTADTRMPGRALLTMRVSGTGSGSRYAQRIEFFPDGVLGEVYWHLHKPVLDPVLSLMAHRIAGAAIPGDRGAGALATTIGHVVWKLGGRPRDHP